VVTAINHLAPPTGNIADNVVGFARALRAAGLPVGPGAVIDAMNALQVIDIGNRGDVYTTLEAIFVKRHEHALIFAQAFDLFFRAAEEWKSLLDSVPLPDHARKKPPPAARRVQEAMSQRSMREEPQVQEQDAAASQIRAGSSSTCGERFAARCGRAGRSSISGNSGGSQNRRRSWRCSISPVR
jgi:uncharacterized protein with von Willebrand factor type A (vWA) domain